MAYASVVRRNQWNLMIYAAHPTIPSPPTGERVRVRGNRRSLSLILSFSRGEKGPWVLSVRDGLMANINTELYDALH